MKTNGLTLGLDIGIGSVGYALLDLTKNKIIFTGVRCFSSGENPKDGKSLAEPRRMSRSARRRLRRRRTRLNQLLRALSDSGVSSKKITSTGHLPWQLRAEGLTRLLSGDELVIALYHIAKRRGYHNQSIRLEGTESTPDSAEEITPDVSSEDSEQTDKEEQKMLAGVAGLRKALKVDGAETVGVFFYKRLSDPSNPDAKVRNESGSYTHTVLRSLLKDEVKLLIERQRQFGNTKLTAELEKRLIDEIIFYQRPLQSSEELVENCTFIPTEKRGPKNAPTLEQFRLLQLLNNTRILTADGIEAKIPPDKFPSILESTLGSGKLTFKQLRRLLGLEPTDRFFGLDYFGKATSKRSTKSADDNPLAAEDTTYISLGGFARIRRSIESIDTNYWDSVKNNLDLLDQIATVLSYEKDINERERQLIGDLLIPPAVANKLSEIQFSSFGRLSLRAAKLISEQMQLGHMYDVACERAAFNHCNPKTGGRKYRRLPELESTNNPVVDRALRQSRKVVNALIKEFGIPEQINIELAREVGKSRKERSKISDSQKELEAANKGRDEEIRNTFGEAFLTPIFRTKYRLWKMQAGRCAYTGSCINTELLRSDDLTQIDHIVPISISGDDSLANKVLVTTASNQNKGKKTPWQHFGHDSAKWESFCEAIANYPAAKKAKLLKKEWTEEDSNNFKKRNLNDTRYAARRFREHLIQYLDFGDDGSNHVGVRHGRLTADLRKLWGLEKNRDESDRHHALDAAVIAASTESNLQKITRYHQRRENYRYGLEPERPKIEQPWEGFSSDVVSAVGKIFVSRPPKIKASGAAHEETIRSQRTRDNGESVIVQRIRLYGFDSATPRNKRISVAKFREDYLDKLWNKPRSSHVIAAIEEALAAGEAAGKTLAAEVFAEPVYLKTRKGERGPQLKSIQIETNEKSGVFVRGQGKRGKGIASNGDMVRIDIFHSSGSKTAKKGYYMVPVYVHHLASTLPNRACVGGKPESEWPEITDEYEFLFSVHRDDLLAIQSATYAIEGYFLKADRATASIAVYDPSSSQNFKKGIGIKTLLSLTKLKVDILGRKYPVEHEERLWPGELSTSRTPHDLASAGLSY